MVGSPDEVAETGDGCDYLSSTSQSGSGSAAVNEALVELTDTVIQRLFRVGLVMQQERDRGEASGCDPAVCAATARLEGVGHELDLLINDLRGTAYEARVARGDPIGLTATREEPVVSAEGLLGAVHHVARATSLLAEHQPPPHEGAAWWAAETARRNLHGASIALADGSLRYGAGAVTRCTEGRAGAMTEFSSLGLDLLPVGVLIADADGQVTVTNRMWLELSGLSNEASAGSGWLRGLPPDDGVRAVDTLRGARDGGSVPGLELRLRVPGGSYRWTRWWITKPRGMAGVVAVAVADVEQEHARRTELEHRAIHDPLTGLVNRAHFVELAEHALRRRAGDGGLVAVLFIDLDGFKDVNDTNGHVVGDLVLVAVAEALERVVRPGDVLARVGGDEFAIMCDALPSRADAAAIAERVHFALEPPLAAAGMEWEVTAAVGVAFAAKGEDTPETILDRADQAMYRAKRERALQ